MKRPLQRHITCSEAVRSRSRVAWVAGYRFEDVAGIYSQPIETGDPLLDNVYTRGEKRLDMVEPVSGTTKAQRRYLQYGAPTAVCPSTASEPGPRQAGLCPALSTAPARSRSRFKADADNRPEAPIVPPGQEASDEIDILVELFYTAPQLSLLAAFLAILAKQCLSSYLQHPGRSSIERPARQHKLDTLEKSRFDLFLKAPTVMLLVAFLLLICGLCWRIWLLHPFILCTFVPLAVFEFRLASEFLSL